MQATERISIRTTPEAKALIEQASQLVGLSVSHFILSTMYEKSLQMLKDETVWKVNQDSWNRLMQELESPSPANQELKDLLALGEELANR
ncbi:type II toxin-antitoxin system TacA family antitoxin [Pelistega suis]|uniref:DUF1778 domain-containing protein n=1 Tax=Pelistega suis TaxID=1631957 RepID=A0A849P492_9BURK|nr:DUF1778 domain-containing protein [Pelistega suis]MCQ9328493.1 DUF1778 domain-containing protein [Pelistega suis]NOL51886.1 DUF1778 domain-containing protein [Pelistega suis]